MKFQDDYVRIKKGRIELKEIKCLYKWRWEKPIKIKIQRNRT